MPLAHAQPRLLAHEVELALVANALALWADHRGAVRLPHDAGAVADAAGAPAVEGELLLPEGVRRRGLDIRAVVEGSPVGRALAGRLLALLALLLGVWLAQRRADALPLAHTWSACP